MNFFIDPKYMSRAKPEYATDNFSSIIFQPKVYALAHSLMSHLSINTLVDIGCGSGDKLSPFFSSGFNVIPIDQGPNTQLFQQRHGFLPISFDLESSNGLDLIVSDALAKLHEPRSMIVCADVIEHMVNPDSLMNHIRRVMVVNGSSMVLISTPDREKLANPSGPPTNRSHVREWTLNEFHSYCSQYFRVLDVCYTTTIVNLDGSSLNATIQILATL
jgi:2-polyprenyl-3-methyl-5-hydroxy-6-metoxy-1,4-benzoquinol methylase